MKVDRRGFLRSLGAAAGLGALAVGGSRAAGAIQVSKPPQLGPSGPCQCDTQGGFSVMIVQRDGMWGICRKRSMPHRLSYPTQLQGMHLDTVFYDEFSPRRSWKQRLALPGS
jgi:hypothetical protein